MKYTSSNETPKSYHLPAGDYDVTIVEASETVSRSTGADMIKLTLDAEAPDGSTTKVFDYLVATPSSAWKIDAFRRALGHEVVQGEPVELAAEDLVGRTLRARLKVEEFNGRQNNKVEAWLAPLAGARPTSPAPATPKQEDDANEPF
ncbi:hypothetical protein ASA1KI_23390 [Opitutales bacterium ASA1]|uniref:DUF669 domain-containing protein n=1 Tax=Congregicoccus parvus TaxID=3081749 RepID=UPI002B2B29E4|nr:hypothetical protein ASA1KI_23390 [Opitutales bacterium ASA1]